LPNRDGATSIAAQINSVSARSPVLRLKVSFEMNIPVDPERQIIEQAIGHFILDLGMIENTMIQALAVLTGVPQARAHFLLNKTAGGAKAALLREAAIAKEIDLEATGLKAAFGTIHKIMDFRNHIVHDAIGFHGNMQKWVRIKGTPTGGDKVFGNKSEIDAAEIYRMGEAAWVAIKVIAIEILEKHGGFTYFPAPETPTPPTSIS
jgi:hypothetical protein